MMPTRQNPKRGFDKVLRPNYNLDNHQLDALLEYINDSAGTDQDTSSSAGPPHDCESEFTAAFGQMNDTSAGQGYNVQQPENVIAREFISDEDSKKIWNIPVDFSSEDTSRQYDDFVYNTKEDDLGAVIDRMGIDIDSIYGNSTKLSCLLKVVKVDRFEMSKYFSSIPMSSSRIAVRLHNGPTERVRCIKLHRFQNFSIAKLHSRGLTFHVSAILVDPKKYAKTAMPMKIEYSQVISIAANISRLLIIAAIHPSEILSRSCSGAEFHEGQQCYKNIIELLRANEESHPSQTQHWLGINKGFCHLCPTEKSYQSFQCNLADASVFANIFDLVLEAMGNKVITVDSPILREKYHMIFPEFGTSTDRNGSKTKRENVIVSMLDRNTTLLQTSAEYVLRNLVYHVSCAGIKNVVYQKSFMVKNDPCHDQAAFEACRDDMMESLSNILDVSKVQEMSNHCVIYGDLGCTFLPKDKFKNCLITPLATKSAYRKVDIESVNDTINEAILDSDDSTSGIKNEAEDEDDDEDEDKDEDEDGSTYRDEDFDEESLYEYKDEEGDRDGVMTPHVSLESCFKEEYELFFHSKMVGKRTVGPVLCTLDYDSSLKLLPYHLRAPNTSTMLHGVVHYVSGSRESKDYLKNDIHLLQKLPHLVRGMCMNNGRCLTADDSKDFDRIIKILEETSTFSNVSELGNQFNLKLRLEYMFQVSATCLESDEIGFSWETFYMDITPMLKTRIVLAPKPYVAQNYYRTIEKSRQLILGAKNDNGADSHLQFQNLQNSNIITTLVLASEFLAYGPGTSTGPQIPFPIMRSLKKKLKNQSGVTDLVYFPECQVAGITISLDEMQLRDGPKFGVSSTLNAIPEQSMLVIQNLLDDLYDTERMFADQNISWKPQVEKLLKDIQSKNFGGHYMKLSRKNYQSMRRVAFQECIMVISQESSKRLRQINEQSQKIIAFTAFVKSLAKIFWVSYYLQIKDDVFKMRMHDLISEGQVPTYVNNNSKLHHSGDISNYEQFLSELFHGHHHSTSTKDKGTSGWITCLYLQVYQICYDVLQDVRQYIITADGNDEWLGEEEFLLATIVRQFLVSFHREAVPIMYKSLKQNRLGAHKNKNKMLYLEVKKHCIWKEIPSSKEDVEKGASLGANLDLGDSDNAMFSCEHSKILDGVTSWHYIYGVHFNLKQTLMMGIYARALMSGHGNTKLWEGLLARNGKSVAKVLWEVLNGERTPASAKEKCCNLTDDVSLLRAIALSGVTCVFGDKNSFAMLAKNLCAKFKRIKDDTNDRYNVLVAKTYTFFKEFQFQSSTSMYNTDCKNVWSLSALSFWQKVANEVSATGNRVTKSAIDAAIENIQAMEELKYYHGDHAIDDIGNTEECEYGHEDQLTNMMSVPPKVCNISFDRSQLMTPTQMPSSIDIDSSSKDDSVVPNNIITPDHVDDDINCSQNSEKIFQGGTEAILLRRYETDVYTPEKKERHNILGKLLEVCDKVTNTYGPEDFECYENWIQEPTEADFKALVAEDEGDLEDALKKLV